MERRKPLLINKLQLFKKIVNRFSTGSKSVKFAKNITVFLIGTIVDAETKI